jgi:Zn-dependent peptidase ImmA (M78 family)/DNA-binding XRE family transcriptional regulator
MNLSRTVGERIRIARQAAGLSQGDLAETLERTRASISMWESGERTPALDDLYAVARALDRPVEFFLPRERAVAPDDQVELTLRAVASRLAGEQLGKVIERVLRAGEAEPAPAGWFSPRSKEPIEAAQEVLSAIEATSPPVSVEDAADALGARVVIDSFGTDALSGFVLHRPDGAVVAANQEQAPTRQRFTIAHELGHIALVHHADFHIDLAHRASDPPGYDWRQERAANAFAANLLMPAGWVRSDYIGGTKSVAQLAKRYGVSSEAMGIRLETLGLST